MLKDCIKQVQEKKKKVVVFFANLNLMLFCRSCCCRRRRCFSSLISMETLIVFPAPVQIHMTTVKGLFSFKIRHIYARTCALALNLQQCKRSSLLNVVKCVNYARATKHTSGSVMATCLSTQQFMISSLQWLSYI